MTRAEFALLDCCWEDNWPPRLHQTCKQTGHIKVALPTSYAFFFMLLHSVQVASCSMQDRSGQEPEGNTLELDPYLP